MIEKLADALEVIQSLVIVSGHSNDAIEFYLKKPQQYAEAKIEYQPHCLFCQIAKEERETNILERFKHCYVIKDEYPVSDGHLLIIPNVHTENWFTATEDVRLGMIKAMHFMKEKLDQEYQPQGYNIGANCGEVAGQSVMHFICT